jgi:hypothetical protein
VGCVLLNLPLHYIFRYDKRQAEAAKKMESLSVEDK